MRFGLYQPYRLTVRCVLWAAWVVIVLSVMTIGSQSPKSNHPVGLLLLGLGCAGSGMLSLLTLFRPAVWERLVDPNVDAREARTHLYGLSGLGVIGAILVTMALVRLV